MSNIVSIMNNIVYIIKLQLQHKSFAHELEYSQKREHFSFIKKHTCN